MGETAIPLSRSELDLAVPDTVPNVLGEVGPEAVINCAAYTNVDLAEREEDLATLVNGRAVSVLSAWCAENSVPLLTFSTDYVFDGTARTPYLESSATRPLNAYGRSKYAGEIAAVQHGALVVRTSWVLSGTHPNFVATMLRVGREQPLSVVDDQLGCPTIAADLAATALQALETGVTGILHLTNEGETTWFGLAREVLKLAGIATDHLEPCATSDYPTPAGRPEYSVLGSERRLALGITELPDWRSSLPGVVSEIETWL